MMHLKNILKKQKLRAYTKRAEFINEFCCDEEELYVNNLREYLDAIYLIARKLNEGRSLKQIKRKFIIRNDKGKVIAIKRGKNSGKYSYKIGNLFQDKTKDPTGWGLYLRQEIIYWERHSSGDYA